MAKSKPKAPAPKPKITAESIEQVIRDAVSAIPGLRDIPEAEYVEIYREALELIDVGLAMRAQELANEEAGGHADGE